MNTFFASIACNACSEFHGTMIAYLAALEAARVAMEICSMNNFC